MIDMIGKQFGRLKVISSTERKNKFGDTYYLCECSCDKHTRIEVLGSNLRKGLTKSCGCYLRQRAHETHMKDITGKNFGYLTAICPTNERRNSFVVWKCHCNYCGRDAYIPISQLMTGQASCGKCNYAADMAHERMIKWRDPIDALLSRKFSRIVSRCYNKNDVDYKDYGARGIYICKDWSEDRTEFIKWAKSNGFKPGLSIDRIDNDGPYAPWNCRWTTSKVQSCNRRSNRYITIMGITGCVSQWAYVLNKQPSTLYQLSCIKDHPEDVEEYIKFVIESSDENERSSIMERIHKSNMRSINNAVLN